MTEHDIRAPAFYYELEAQDDDPLESDEGPWKVSGIAVGEDSILRTDDGTPVLFSDDVLKASADTQRGQPLSVDHPTDEDGQPTYPPPTDETVGKVVNAGYRPGKGLVYEATVHDEEIAKGIQAGSYEVSVHPVWKGFSERDEATGAYKPEGVKFLDLSVVSHGMDRANEARLGPSKELAAWARETDIGEELTADDAVRDDVDEDTQGLIEKLARKTGILPTGVEATADSHEPDGSQANEPAESGADSTENMGDGTSDGTTSGDGQNDDPDGGGGSDEPTLGEMTPSEAASALGDELKEQGFVTEDNADEVVAQAKNEIEQSEKVDEIIAQSDAYDEDDRDELIASSEKVIDNEYKRVRKQNAAGLPGNTGHSSTLTAGASRDSGSDPSEYGTGVEGDGGN